MAIARHRRTDPVAFAKLLRGDLDWIVMKALEKDWTRRLKPADGFAAILEGYKRSVEALAFSGDGQLEEQALAQANFGTTGRPDEGDPWRFGFHADGTYSHNREGRDEWKAIGENTIVAGRQPLLWAITFDAVRMRGRPRSPTTRRNRDSRIVRAPADDSAVACADKAD